mgnify:CR=1 FL=1
MRKNEKVVFGSVILTIMSILAYNAENILFLILFSGAASVGYWMACGNPMEPLMTSLIRCLKKALKKRKRARKKINPNA